MPNISSQSILQKRTFSHYNHQTSTNPQYPQQTVPTTFLKFGKNELGAGLKSQNPKTMNLIPKVSSPPGVSEKQKLNFETEKNEINNVFTYSLEAGHGRNEFDNLDSMINLHSQSLHLSNQQSDKSNAEIQPTMQPPAKIQKLTDCGNLNN